ncbi:MAG: hypothetical protein M1828_001414 [Chrysothrix sp. TS-e1954]|nr:MAG: hypothetical protein M1828_001414 [Chrysothrix sp. TS-e1954]
MALSFLDLFPEIRNKIYTYAFRLGEQRVLIPRDRSSNSLALQASEPLAFGTTLSCKQTYQESIRFLYDGTFAFQSSHESIYAFFVRLDSRSRALVTEIWLESTAMKSMQVALRGPRKLREPGDDPHAFLNFITTRTDVQHITVFGAMQNVLQIVQKWDERGRYLGYWDNSVSNMPLTSFEVDRRVDHFRSQQTGERGHIRQVLLSHFFDPACLLSAPPKSLKSLSVRLPYNWPKSRPRKRPFVIGYSDCTRRLPAEGLQYVLADLWKPSRDLEHHLWSLLEDELESKATGIPKTRITLTCEWSEQGMTANRVSSVEQPWDILTLQHNIGIADVPQVMISGSAAQHRDFRRPPSYDFWKLNVGRFMEIPS